MRLLIDSHVFLWMLFAPERLGARAVDAIDRADAVSLSVASLWELALKHAKGELPHAPGELAEGVDELSLNELPIRRRHLSMLNEIELPHGDPFDGMLVAQARVDSLTLVTADRPLLASPYATLDARR
ncbi:type II toxin-antitoxin system VapC family toxin [Microbacterium sp.]|uniref:type II toxin-antitoxin system VapC family toxin n=1 Tax=Microbacterium sp. TaxID=51671 RepID=UPI003C7327C2